MPARRPVTPKPRDQIVTTDTSGDKGKERMIAESARVLADASQRLARLDAQPAVTGSRASGDALGSLLEALTSLGLIKDETTL